MGGEHCQWVSPQSCIKHLQGGKWDDRTNVGRRKEGDGKRKGKQQRLGCVLLLLSSVLPTYAHTPLCCGQTTGYFCLLKCSLCQIRWLKSPKFMPFCGRDTWQTTPVVLSFCLSRPLRGKKPPPTKLWQNSSKIDKNKIKCAVTF